MATNPKQVRLNYFDLSGGMDAKTSPLFLRDNECELIQNYHLDNVGSLTKRPGIAYLIGQIVDGVSILGMYYFKDIQGTDYSNVLVANNVVGVATSGISKIVSMGSSTTQFDITNTAGTTYRYTYDGTGTDPLITTSVLQVGSSIVINAQNFTAANNGTFTITAVGANYFSVTNASGVAEANKTIGTGSITTWYLSKTGDTASALPVMFSFIDYAFRVNGSEVMASSVDLTTWAAVNCMTTYKFKYGCIWEDRAYVLNDNSTNKKPSRISWSSLPVSGNPLTITWAYNGTTDAGKDAADINPDDNDEITWGEPFGKRLLIFKTKAIYNWRFGQVEPDKIIDVGTPQGRTVKVAAGICFFLGNHNNKYGVYAYDGETLPKKISRKVQPFIDAISTITNCRAEVDDDHYKLYIGDVTVNGETYSNTMLVYTISVNGWHYETYPFEIKSMARFERKTLGSTEIYDGIYIGDDDGFVYRLGTGTSDYLGTTAKPIAGRIITKECPLYNFPSYSNLDNLDFLAQQGTGAKVNYRIERGDWEGWKDLQRRITSDKIAGKARTLQFSITDNSTTTSQIEGFSILLKEEIALRRDEGNG